MVRPRRRFSGEDQRTNRSTGWYKTKKKKSQIRRSQTRRDDIPSNASCVEWEYPRHEGPRNPNEMAACPPSSDVSGTSSLGTVALFFFFASTRTASEPRHALSRIHYTASDVPSLFLCIFEAMNVRVLLFGERENNVPYGTAGTGTGRRPTCGAAQAVWAVSTCQWL